MTEKTCIHCDKTKIFKEFYFNKGVPFQPCKECARARAREYYKSHKIQRLAYSQQYMKSNKSKLRSYRRKHRDKISAYYKKYYEANKERLAFRRKLKREINKIFVEKTNDAFLQ